MSERTVAEASVADLGLLADEELVRLAEGEQSRRAAEVLVLRHQPRVESWTARLGRRDCLGKQAIEDAAQALLVVLLTEAIPWYHRYWLPRPCPSSFRSFLAWALHDLAGCRSLPGS